MKTTLLHLIFGFIAFNSLAQVPSVRFFDIPGTEEPPTLVPSGTGGFYLTNNLSKSNPDSTFASFTYLDANLSPQWNRVLKSKTHTTISGLSVEPGGASVMVNVYNTQGQTSPIFYQFDQNGNTTQTIEIQDSSVANLTTSPFFSKIKLADGCRIFFSSSAGIVMRINPENKVDFSRQFRFGNSATNFLAIQAGAVIPGTNQWLISGYITNTSLAYVLKFQDTTMVFAHVYNFNPLASTMSISNIHVLPNQEVLLGWNDNSRHMHNVKISANGEIIWRKLHKMTAIMNPGRMTVANNGDIWMHGSITAGQAGGLLVHLSPTGQFIGRRGQSKLGNSHGNFTSLVEMPDNELLTLQKGYYNNSPILFLNRIQTSMNFLCFDSNVGNFIDTTYAISDSATTIIKPIVRKFGAKSSLTVPFQVRNLTVTTGNVVCTPTTDVEEPLVDVNFTLFPNPVTDQLKLGGLNGQPEIRIFSLDGRLLISQPGSEEISVSRLPSGLYILEVPGLGIRRRFSKE